MGIVELKTFNIMAFELTDSNYKEIIGKSEIPVMVDFWAEWCGPCRMIAPIVEELSRQFKDKILVAKCDVDDCPRAAAEFGIRNIPTILFFKNGELVDKQVGSAPKPTLEAKMNALL